MSASPVVFLSYHSPDRTDIVAIQEVLQRHGIDTFLDRDNLQLGLSWFEGLQEALGRARAVVVLLGPGELGVWQKREIALALDRQANLERTATQLLVIPVLLPKAQPEQAPAFLMLNNGLMLTRPIAEDAQAITRLVQALGGATPAITAPLTRPALCPYRGLDAFREEDAALFFGRDSFVEKLLDRVLHHPVVAVVGASGSGKSSVVQAGLLPRLRRQGGTAPTWDAIVCTPGTQPFHRLATALLPLLEPSASVTDRLVASGKLGDYLATGGYLSAVITQATDLQQVDRLLLVIDQFEELFTQTPADQRTAFIATLLQATHDSRLRLVFTLRADFYGAVLGASRDLSDCLEKAQVTLGPARPAELRQMIEEPARKAGLTFEAGLLTRILDDLISQPGNLPLLEYALKELWLARQDTHLTHAGYEAIGEVAGAISQQADAIFSRLSPAQQAAGWRLLGRLVRVAAASEEGTDTRRRVPLNQLDQEAQQVAHRFATPDVRLLVFAREPNTEDTTVEVAHEALIRNWARLREWLQQERAFLLWRQDLEKDVAEWRQLRQEKAALYAGSKLARAIQLTRGRTADLLPAEQDFLRQSQVQAGKAGRLLKWAAGFLLVAATALGGGWGWRHWTVKGQVALVNDELSDLAATTTSSKVTYWSAARYLLAGNVDKALTTSVSLPQEGIESLWDKVLDDSLSRQQMLTAPRIGKFYQQEVQLNISPDDKFRLLRTIASAYSKLVSQNPVADSGLRQALANIRPLLNSDSAAYARILPKIAAAYSRLEGKQTISEQGLKQLLVSANPLLKYNYNGYAEVLLAVATAYGKLTGKIGMADSCLRQVLATAPTLLNSRKPDAYARLRLSVAAAYSTLAGKETVADSLLRQLLAETRPRLESRPNGFPFTLLLSTAATSYGKLANKATVADNGLRQLLAEARPLLESNSGAYSRVLSSVANTYSALAGETAVADNGLRQVLAEAQPLLRAQPAGYTRVLASVAAAYGALADKPTVTDNGLRLVSANAKLLLEVQPDSYPDVLSAVAATYSALASKPTIINRGLQQLLAEAQPLLKSQPTDYISVLSSVAAACDSPANTATMVDDDLRQVLTQAKPLLDSQPDKYTHVLASAAAAYGALASKPTVTDNGLRLVLAMAQPLLKSNLTTRTAILDSVAAAYGKLASDGSTADRGLRHVLVATRPLLNSSYLDYDVALRFIATAYGRLLAKGAVDGSGLRQLLAEAKPLLDVDATSYADVLETVLAAYLKRNSTTGTAVHRDLQQLSEAVESLLKKDNTSQSVRILFAQLLAKHQQFAQAYSLVDKLPSDDRAQALYLILERYYHPTVKPSEIE